MFRLYLAFLIKIGIVFVSFPIVGFADRTNLNKKSTLNETTDKCEKKFLKGVSFSKTDTKGEKVTVRIRFAPFVLSPSHTTQFQKYRSNYEKKYGALSGASVYESLVCSYFFGSYSFVQIPLGELVLDKLLKECPIKTLKDSWLAPGPRRDCAPAAGVCEPFEADIPQQTMDRIPCQRKWTLD